MCLCPKRLCSARQKQTLQYLEPWKNWCKERFEIMLFQVYFSKWKFFKWYLEERNQAGNYRDKWETTSRYINTLAVFGKFGLEEFSCNDQIETFSHRKNLKKCKVFHCHLGDKNQTCSYVKTWIRKSGWSVDSYIFWKVWMSWFLMQRSVAISS